MDTGNEQPPKKIGRRNFLKVLGAIGMVAVLGEGDTPEGRKKVVEQDLWRLSEFLVEGADGQGKKNEAEKILGEQVPEILRNDGLEIFDVSQGRGTHRVGVHILHDTYGKGRVTPPERDSELVSNSESHDSRGDANKYRLTFLSDAENPLKIALEVGGIVFNNTQPIPGNRLQTRDQASVTTQQLQNALDSLSESDRRRAFLQTDEFSKNRELGLRTYRQAYTFGEDMLADFDAVLAPYLDNSDLEGRPYDTVVSHGRIEGGGQPDKLEGVEFSVSVTPTFLRYSGRMRVVSRGFRERAIRVEIGYNSSSGEHLWNFGVPARSPLGNEESRISVDREEETPDIPEAGRDWGNVRAEKGALYVMLRGLVDPGRRGGIVV